MEKVLLLLHTESEGGLTVVALEALRSALDLAGSSLVVGLVGGEVQPAADSIAACGAARFLGVAGEAFAVSRYATDAAAAEAIARASEAAVILAPGTSRWSRALAGVCQRLGGRIDTHAVGIARDGDAIVVSRWYYRQRIEVDLTRSARPWMILLDSGSSPAWSGPAGAARVEMIDVAAPQVRIEVVGIEAPRSDQQTICPEAGLLLVAGAGWTKKQKDGQVHADEAGTLILDFVHRAKASLGSSKSLVDLSGEGQAVLPFLTHLHQVGQTGSTPRHPKGLATCCHGEEPHVVGWRFINDRRAINLDAGCGWARGKADVLYVADAFEVMAKVNELLGK